MFICPYSGIYWFSVSCLSKDVQRCMPAINVERDTILKTQGTDDVTSGQASTSTVVECSAGQRVWVRNEGDNGVYNGYNHMNSFSGYLLYRYE